MTWSISKHTLRGALAASMLAPGLGACASKATTPQLVEARNAYDDAESSPAPERAPGELASAEVALDRAEQAHDANPGSQREANLAAVAERRAKTAEAKGEARDEAYDRADARQEIVDERAEARAEHRADVRADVRSNERAQDRKASAALQNLGPVANVKEEPRGVVITLSGSLLFPSGKEEMSPVARQNIGQVAHAIAQQPKDSKILVEGHTDNSGSDAQNEELSAKRARAVADQLIESGVDSDRIEVVGRGETHPIANNDTDAGRATNRRVEIVVEKG